VLLHEGLLDPGGGGEAGAQAMARRRACARLRAGFARQSRQVGEIAKGGGVDRESFWERSETRGPADSEIQAGLLDPASDVLRMARTCTHVPSCPRIST
jgi:hypothetical protein